MTTALQRLFPSAIYNATNLHFTPLAKAGLAAAALTTVVYYKLSEDQKEELTTGGVSLIHKVTDPDNITDADARQMLWKCKESIVNCSLAGPAFYGAYHVIHPSGLEWRHHLSQAALRGLSGTCKATPVNAVLYSLAALVVPYVQNRMMEGKSYPTKEEAELGKQAAAGSAETASFLMAVPFELLAETLGYGLSPSQLTAKLTGIATLALMVRMVSGTLPQFQDLKQTGDAQDPAARDKRLLYCVFGTSVSQFPLNAAVESMKADAGTKGFFNYLTRGNVQGIGSWKSGAAQLGRVAFQRAAFLYTWRQLNDQSLQSASLLQPPHEPGGRVIESE
ncbi:MAG: hypothetical protein V4492_07750 [Chlamydiota bacterium]